MTEYLTKEEVRQWRSSLERITLEEFARRLGKVINEEKSTNDVVDKVMKDIKFDDSVKPEYQTKAEKINVIARETLVREKEIVNSVKPKSVNVEPVAKVESKTELEETIVSEEKEVKKSVKAPKIQPKKEEKVEKQTKKAAKTVKLVETKASSDDDFPVVLKKCFTAREQVVFDHLLTNKNTVVYAKDLAELLGLPRDYIYKYIKGIRAKMEQDVLSNAEKGGFVLKV